MIKYIAIFLLYTLIPILDVFWMIGNFIIWLLLWCPFNKKLFDTRYMVWKADPLGGLLNRNWLFKFQAVIHGFSGDCDKFATMTKWQNADSKVVRYTCIYPNIFKINKTHVVAIVNDVILCDNGKINSGGMDLLKRKYPDRIIVRMPY